MIVACGSASRLRTHAGVDGWPKLVPSSASVSPYGVDQYPAQLGPSEHSQKEGFIFVYQDARGRYMSEGEFQQVRPFNAAKGPKDIDESTDTYDTIEWLLKNIVNNNGRAGMIGISQPGFHVAASIINSHPALKVASPQAPTASVSPRRSYAS